MTFNDLGIIDPILKALEEEGYTTPTPIQQQSIPKLLLKHDLLACAQTGTGKTAAFAIPILQHLYADPQPTKGRLRTRALVIAPTRELAIQIADNFTAYGRHTGIRSIVIFGGVNQGPQETALRKGADILVATPGRLLDLLSQGFVSFQDIQYLVLDEADRMLDMGFIHDIKKIIAQVPKNRQSLFFSATMAPEIVELSRKILGSHPDHVSVQPEQTTAERIEQELYFVSKKDKPKLLVHLLQAEPGRSTIVFSRTKHGANKIVKSLDQAGIPADAIHGNKSQAARQKALGAFRSGKSNVLVATDIAARGIDVDDLSQVINFDLPNIPETYVHRIGRTGRAGASGIARSFCEAEERPFLRDIQKLIGQTIPVVRDHPYPEDGSTPEPEASTEPRSARPVQKPQRSDRPQQQRNEARRSDRPRQDRQEPRQRDDAQSNAPRPERTNNPERGPQRNERRQQQPDAQRSESRPQSGNGPADRRQPEQPKPQAKRPQEGQPGQSGTRGEGSKGGDNRKGGNNRSGKPARSGDKPAWVSKSMWPLE
jgi:ATP-dependent RNA helicase RhlE